MKSNKNKKGYQEEKCIKLSGRAVACEVVQDKHTTKRTQHNTLTQQLNQRQDQGKMACGSGLRPIFLTEPWPSLPYNSTSNLSNNTSRCFGCRFIKTTNFYQFSRKTHHFKCTHAQNPSSDDEFDPDFDQGPPQEAVLKAISGSPFLPILITFLYMFVCIISVYVYLYVCMLL